MRCCVAVRRSVRVIVFVAVGHPLPHVAMHIVEAEGIRLERADRSRLLLVPLATAAITIGAVLADLIAPGVFGATTRPRRILPFGFGQQAVSFLAGLL